MGTAILSAETLREEGVSAPTQRPGGVGDGGVGLAPVRLERSGRGEWFLATESRLRPADATGGREAEKISGLGTMSPPDEGDIIASSAGDGEPDGALAFISVA